MATPWCSPPPKELPLDRKDDFHSAPTPDFLTFLQEETNQEQKPLIRAPVQGWIQIAFWALRIYVALMLIIVAIGFARGIH